MRRRYSYLISRSTWAGAPAATENGGRSVVTTEVRAGIFPGPEHTYSIDDEELERFRAELG